MRYQEVEARRRARATARRARIRRRRLTALGSLVAVLGIAAGLLTALGGPGAKSVLASRGRRSTGARQPAGAQRERGATPATYGTGRPGHATVPILMYHVINPPIAGAPYPGL